VPRKHYCADHLVQHKKNYGKQVYQQKKQYEKDRGSAASRGYGKRWQKAREYFLNHNPICIRCERDKEIIKPARVVDHIRPHKGNQKLFWDRENWQALCKPCHDRKTVLEDGGFGNATTSDTEPEGLL
jgi:5-methylcytosine-specific restriction protein A